MQGYIQIHRKMWENPVFSDPHLLKLWIHCLMKATHKEHDQLVGTNAVVRLLPGQFITGRFALAAEYNKGVTPSKMVSDITLWRWLKSLEKMQMLNIKTTNKYSVITITNWCRYQGNEQQMNNKRTTNEQQMNTNNNGNNEKNKNTVLFEEWWTLYGNKKGRVKCESKYKQLLKKYKHQEIITGTEKYLEHRKQLASRKEFVPQQKNPLTFLNGEHFNDEYEQSSTTTNYQEFDFDLNRGEDM